MYLFEHRTDSDRTALASVRAASSRPGLLNTNPTAGPTASVPGDILGPLLAMYCRVVKNKGPFGALLRTITLPATSGISFASPPTGGRLRSQGDEGGINGAEADEASGTDAADAAASSASNDGDDGGDDDGSSALSDSSDDSDGVDQMEYLAAQVRHSRDEQRKVECYLEDLAMKLAEQTSTTEAFVLRQKKVKERATALLSSARNRGARKELRKGIRDAQKAIDKAGATIAELQSAIERKKADMARLTEKITDAQADIQALNEVRQAQQAAASIAPPGDITMVVADDNSVVTLTDRPANGNGDNDNDSDGSPGSPMEEVHLEVPLGGESVDTVVNRRARDEAKNLRAERRARQARAERRAELDRELDRAGQFNFNPGASLSPSAPSLSTPTNNHDGGSDATTPQTRNPGSRASPTGERRPSPPLQRARQAAAAIGTAIRNRLSPGSSPPNAGTAPVAVADANYADPVGEDLTMDTSLLPDLNMIEAILSSFRYTDDISATGFLEAMGPRHIIQALDSLMHTVNQKKLNFAMEKILAALKRSDYARSDVAKEILGQAMAEGYGAVYLPDQKEYLDSGIHSEIHIFIKGHLSDHYKKNRASGIKAWRPVHDPNMQGEGANVGIPVPTQLAQPMARVLVLLGAFSEDFHANPINFQLDHVKKFFVLNTEGEEDE